MSVAVVMRPVSSSSLGMYTIVPAKAQAAETERADSKRKKVLCFNGADDETQS
jgi:hypothetical protein